MPLGEKQNGKVLRGTRYSWGRYWVYLQYTEENGGKNGGTVVGGERGRYSGYILGRPKNIVTCRLSQ